MTDKEKEIVQALRCTSTPGSLHEDCTGCPYYRKEKLDAELKEKLGVDTWPSCDVNKVGMDAADLIELLTAENAALREKQRWIPVTERLPDERDAVIILLKDGQVFRGEIRERIALPEWWYFTTHPIRTWTCSELCIHCSMTDFGCTRIRLSRGCRCREHRRRIYEKSHSLPHGFAQAEQVYVCAGNTPQKQPARWEVSHKLRNL